MDVISRMRQTGEDDQEVQNDPHIGDPATSYESRAVALCGEMDARDGVGYEWSEELHAERNEVLYEE